LSHRTEKLHVAFHLPQARDEGEVEVEDILEPLNGSRGLVSQDLDEIGPGLVSCGLECVIVELLDTIGDAMVDLGTGEGTVDTRGGLGRVTAEESYEPQAKLEREIRPPGGEPPRVSTQKAAFRRDNHIEKGGAAPVLTLLVKDNDVSTGKVDGVRSAETRHYFPWLAA